jgi:ribosomal protein L7/L12
MENSETSERIATLESQVAWLMSTVNAMIAHSSGPLREMPQVAPIPYSGQVSSPTLPPSSGNPGVTQEVLDLVSSGNSFAAIKRYRELTGVGLKEAKDAIDALT